MIGCELPVPEASCEWLIRRPAAGHQPTVATGSDLEARLVDAAPEAITNRSPPDQGPTEAGNRPALASERVQTDAAGQVVLELKTPWRDDNTHLVLSSLEFTQRPAALVPRPSLLTVSRRTCTPAWISRTTPPRTPSSASAPAM